MSRPVPRVQDELCLRCATCAAQKACRVRALVRIEADDTPFLDSTRCTGCLRCLLVCPARAILEPMPHPRTDA